MIELDYKHCTGCGACVQSCPKHCITFQKTELGHLMPEIDRDLCIGCGQCQRVCPIEKPNAVPENQKFYAVVNRDSQILKHSTSGGFFSVLAEDVLEKEGVVYGCAFENDFQARHIRVENISELERLRGSKYLQSNTGNTFVQVRQDLKMDRTVLYTGTPCQIAGLQSFLGKNYENLITVDIICHGVGSQAFFDRYMDFMKKKYGPISELHFRRKDFAGWSCGGVLAIERGPEKQSRLRPYYDYNNYYYCYFLRGDIYRECCYTCKYANTNRPGDFTMGDFWGVESLKLDLDTAGGCSLILVNSEKAHDIFDSLQEKLSVVEVSREQATKENYQLVHPTKSSAIRSRLIEQFETMDGVQMDRAFRAQNKKAILRLHLKSLVPYRLKRVLRKMR